MDRLLGRLQHYDWGSHTALAALRGLEPTGRPEAELWYGAHPSLPAAVDRGAGPEPLDAVVSADPSSELGPAAGLRDGALPYLVKFLASDAPLSIQAHPDRATAEAGFAAENDANVPLDSPKRTFRDARAKPELVVAVTPFRALCGFRPVDEAIGVAAALGLPDDLMAPLRERGPVAWPDVVARALAGDPDGAVDALVERCNGRRPPTCSSNCRSGSPEMLRWHSCPCSPSTASSPVRRSSSVPASSTPTSAEWRSR